MMDTNNIQSITLSKEEMHIYVIFQLREIANNMLILYINAQVVTTLLNQVQIFFSFF